MKRIFPYLLAAVFVIITIVYKSWNEELGKRIAVYEKIKTIPVAYVWRIDYDPVSQKTTFICRPTDSASMWKYEFPLIAPRTLFIAGDTLKVVVSR